MNENELRVRLEEWMRDEAPGEAPDWIIEAVAGRTAGLDQAAGRSPSSRWWLLAAATLLGVALAAAAAVGALNLLLPRPDAETAPRVVRNVEVGARIVIGAAVLGDQVWVGDAGSAGVIRMDAVGDALPVKISTYERPPASVATHPLVSDVVAAFGSIWTVDEEFGTVSRIEPRTGEVIAQIEVGPYPGAAAASAGALWVVSGTTGLISRIDPATNLVTDELALPISGQSLVVAAADEKGVWIAAGGRVFGVDPVSRRTVADVQLGGDLVDIAVAGSVWVADRGRATVWEIDPDQRAVIDGYQVGTAPGALAVMDELIWVGDRTDGLLRAVDRQSGEIETALAVGRGVSAIGISDRRLWVLNQVDATLTEVALAR